MNALSRELTSKGFAEPRKPGFGASAKLRREGAPTSAIPEAVLTIIASPLAQSRNGGSRLQDRRDKIDVNHGRELGLEGALKAFGRCFSVSRSRHARMQRTRNGDTSVPRFFNSLPAWPASLYVIHAKRGRVALEEDRVGQKHDTPEGSVAKPGVVRQAATALIERFATSAAADRRYPCDVRSVSPADPHSAHRIAAAPPQNAR
ncbi:MAG: hypothetical protein J0I21_12470 [Alphaproteobacteria bacterium]|nr:hypothetical protein [Alphaproteobacteria bacterium]